MEWPASQSASTRAPLGGSVMQFTIGLQNYNKSPCSDPNRNSAEREEQPNWPLNQLAGAGRPLLWYPAGGDKRRGSRRGPADVGRD